MIGYSPEHIDGWMGLQRVSGVVGVEIVGAEAFSRNIDGPVPEPSPRSFKFNRPTPTTRRTSMR